MSQYDHAQDSEGDPTIFSTANAVDLYTQRMREPTLTPPERKAVDRYFDQRVASVLDIGCGAGRVSSILHQEGFDVIGIDVSEPLVERARDLCPDIEFQVANITNTEFRSQSFDYALFSWYGIDYLTSKSERVAALREIYRLLEPGGILVLSTHNSWAPFVPLSLRDLGMGVKDVYDLYLRKQNRARLGSRVRTERVPLGDVDIYLGNPIHHWIQLRKCGFTPIEVIGEREGPARWFERNLHFVAKK